MNQSTYNKISGNNNILDISIVLGSKNRKNLLKEYCDSILSFHAIEHLGLGRYNDPIDNNDPIKAIANIYRILKPNRTSIRYNIYDF